MNLPSPVTLDLPPSRLPDGTVREFPPKNIDSLEVVIVDNATQRIAGANIMHVTRRPITLWQGDAYDAAGDYTQAQAEARLLEVLGPDLKAGLQALISPPARPA